MKKRSHWIGVTAAVFWSFSSPVQADEKASEIACTGQNLMGAIQSEAPKIAENLVREAHATLFGTGLTWKIEKEGTAPSYLFGTIHLADPRLLELKPATQAAFDKSRVLALEVTEILDPAKIAAIAFKLLQHTTYTDGSSLKDRLTKEQIAKISELVKNKMGLPWSVASRMKPWALMGALALPACEMARKRAQKPVVDVHLGLKAKSQGKTIVALETMLGQIKTMDSLPEKFSVGGLLQTISLGSRMDDLFETMIQLYLKEETATIWSLMRRVGEKGFVAAKDNADYAAFQEVIVDQRNQTMAAEAVKHIDKGGAFIAVGALHLPGKKGMVNILAQRGYRISRIKQ